METYKKVQARCPGVNESWNDLVPNHEWPENSPWAAVRPVISSDLACGSQVHTLVSRPPCRAVREYFGGVQQEADLKKLREGRALTGRNMIECAKDI